MPLSLRQKKRRTEHLSKFVREKIKESSTKKITTMKNLVKKAEKREFWSVAKRVMIVAIMVIGFIMPAQVSAQNANRGEKGRQEMVQKKNDRKGGDIKKNDKKFDKKNNFAKNNKGVSKNHNKGHKPNVVVVEHHHHNKPVIVHHNKSVVVHHHDNVVHHHCNGNGVAEAATAVIGLAALIALIAN